MNEDDKLPKMFYSTIWRSHDSRYCLLEGALNTRFLFRQRELPTRHFLFCHASRRHLEPRMDVTALQRFRTSHDLDQFLGSFFKVNLIYSDVRGAKLLWGCVEVLGQHLQELLLIQCRKYLLLPIVSQDHRAVTTPGTHQSRYRHQASHTSGNLSAFLGPVA